MIGQEMQDALNVQINAEIYSAYLYLSMSAYFEYHGLKGFANWMRVQWQEELFHATKMIGYVQERGGRVLLSPVDGPPTEWDSPLAAFKQTAEHEYNVTSRINDLVDLAIKESDHATRSFLMWYVNEQVEEESSVDAVIQKLKIVGEAGPGLFLLDNELAQRVFAPPAASGGAEAARAARPIV